MSAPSSGRASRRFASLAALALLALASACSSLAPAAKRRLEVFDTYVAAIAESYPFFAQKNLDWNALAESQRAVVPQVETESDFWHLLAGLLAELDDPHVSLQVPDANWLPDGSPAASLLDVPGFSCVRHGRDVLVVRFPPDQAPTPPAHLAESDRALPRLERIDGALVRTPLVDVLARGEPGSRAELQLLWKDGTRTHHALVRPTKGRPASGTGAKVRKVVISSTKDSAKEAELEGKASLEIADGIARLRIRSFDAEATHSTQDEVREHFAKLLRELTAADALLIDLVDNPGGHADLAFLVLRSLIDAPLELVHDAEERSSWFGLFTTRVFRSSVLTPQEPHFAGPVVVLTSANTASAAELLARSLQRTGRAAVVGERTDGAEAAIETVTGPDGSALRFGKLRWRDTNGGGFQGDGVVPDVAVVLDVDAARREGSFDKVRRAWFERAMAAALARLREEGERRKAPPKTDAPTR